MGHTGESLIDQGEWVLVLLGHGVELAVVDAETEAAITLDSEQDRGGPGRAAGFDEALLEVISDVFPCGFKFLGR
jgi:hypothetical protein